MRIFWLSDKVASVVLAAVPSTFLKRDDYFEAGVILGSSTFSAGEELSSIRLILVGPCYIIIIEINYFNTQNGYIST